MKNIFDIEKPKGGEVFDSPLRHKNVKIERIVSSNKIGNKEFTPEQDEWVILLNGRAKLDLGGNVHELREGDYLFIPAGQKHKVLETKSGTVWLVVHIF